ncbi:inositol monophosphatase [Microbacterium sp. LRZ72]|uniref:inositol monophosphatase family protein n=1 Tax=Microbacterium sp. LRZ72 TaxID=2942481 RepID=UPI0029A17422|nr:inositol monophosphatase family protein [Microbacterium sp. LRZ72]MDX2376779.1 inositol monophosphatase [Microbacterium sp. LRZ72]
MSRETDLSDLAVDIAREAGDLARRRRDEGVSIAATKSTLADIVTEADREVERLIRDRLEVERPGDGFLGEESGAAAGSTGLTWVVDPIDGTVNYAYGIPGYAISIGVVEGAPEPAAWTALAGVVHNPATGETFRAVKDGGAHLGGRRLAVNAEPADAGALIATGFSYDPDERAAQLAVLARVLPMARDIRRMGAASLDLAAVAAGRVDAYYERGLWPWDMAAGGLLVEEAGGRFAGAGGAALGRGLVIAAAPRLFDALDAVLTS